jgi:hypothetical protein
LSNNGISISPPAQTRLRTPFVDVYLEPRLVDHEPKRMHRLHTAQRFGAVIKGVTAELWEPRDLHLKNISASISLVFSRFDIM